jgi:porin
MTGWRQGTEFRRHLDRRQHHQCLGGTGRGAIHFGRFDLSVDGDLEKLVGWTGGKFYVNALGLYGRGLSRNYIHNLATISEIEACPRPALQCVFRASFYNNALNYQDRAAGGGRRVFDSQTDDLFINGTFGWPANKANNLPPAGRRRRSRCPAFASRLRCRTRSPCSARCSTAMPARPGDGDPQLRDNHGLAFRVNDPPWLIGQVRWSYDLDFGRGPLAGNFTPGAGIIPAVRRSALSPRKAPRSPIPGVPHRRQTSRQFRNLCRRRADALPAASVTERASRRRCRE